jgi:hypothetical protein
MGTSQSSTGPGSRSPLVPPWADDKPEQPLPLPTPARFKSFRRSLGSYISNNERSQLNEAVAHYARTASGGSESVARRLGKITKAGANLFYVLNGATPSPGDSPIDLKSLLGLPCEQAISIIAQALTPEDGDKDKICSAMQHALIEALDGIDTFDTQSITDDVLINIMIGYLSESIFLQIVMDAGRAWNRAKTSTQALQAELALRELIKVVVDKYMEPKLNGNIRSFSRSQMFQLERDVIVNVWKEWAAYQ